MRLYTVVEAVPSRILGLANFLHSTADHGYTRDQAVALIQPESLRKGASADPDMCNKVIAAARELGLIEEYENERGDPCLRLKPDVALAPGSADTIREYWARWLAQRVLRELPETVSIQLVTVFAWLLTIEISDLPSDLVQWKSRFERDGFSLEEYHLNNDARWDNVFDWARFLGLIWHIGTGSGQVVCDPTTLLVRFLPELLPDRGQISAGEFRTRLGRQFPVLDGGYLFEQVRAKVIAARGESRSYEDRWSAGLSMALRTLRDRDLIRYHCPDDQRTFLLFDDGERMAFVRRGEGSTK